MTTTTTIDVGVTAMMDPFEQRILQEQQAAQLAELQQATAAEDAADALLRREMRLVFAKGGTIDFGEMRRLGVSPDDLKKAAENYRGRCEDDAARRAKPAAEQAARRANDAERAELNRFSALVAEHQQRLYAIQATRDEATSQLIAASNAERDLLRGCGDPTVLADLIRIESRLPEIDRESNELKRQRRDKASALGQYVARADKPDPGDTKAIERLDGEVREFDRQIQDLSSEASRLNDTWIKTKARSFDPTLI